MTKNFKFIFALVMFIIESLGLYALSTHKSLDTIPVCGNKEFISTIYLRKYKLNYQNESVMPIDTFGIFQNGESFSYALLNNPFDNSNYYLVGTLDGYIGYTIFPDSTVEYYILTLTDYHLNGNYPYITGIENSAFIKTYSIDNRAEFYYYSPQSPPILLRNDLNLIGIHIAIDSDLNLYFARQKQGTNFEIESILVMDTTGLVFREFTFDLPFNSYNVQGMGIIGDSLYYVSGSLNPLYPNSLIHVDLNCENFSASVGQVIPLVSNLDINNICSCHPGNPAKNCEPNVWSPPNIITSIEKPETSEFHVYPNPAKNFIQIDGANTNNLLINLKNINGKTILWKHFSQNNQINISELPNGMYFLELRNEDQVIIRKFIKQ